MNTASGVPPIAVQAMYMYQLLVKIIEITAARSSKVRYGLTAIKQH